MTHRTPRGILQGVLAPTLLNPALLDRGAYPGPEVESTVIERRPLPAVLTRRVETRIEGQAERSRYRRVLAYWGDHRAEALRDADGDDRYAGVKVRVIEAFGLPRIGEESAGAAIPIAPPTPDPGPSRPPPPAVADPVVAEPYGGEPRRPPRPPSGVRTEPGESTRPGTSTPSVLKTTRRDFEEIRSGIQALQAGGPLSNPTKWNNVVYELVRRIDPRRVGLDRSTFARVFTPDLVKIENTGAARGSHFVVPREAWLFEGLEAIATLRIEADIPQEEGEYLRRRLAFAMRQLETLAAAHVRDRTPRTGEDAPFRPVFAIVQILLLRAWLRGTVSADAPTDEQWGALLSDEDGAEAAPTTRTKAWQEVLSATNQNHVALRRVLHEMVSLPQGDANTFGVADTGDAAVALVALRDVLAPAEVPVISRNEAMSEVDEVVSSVALRIFTGLRSIPVAEQRMQAERASALSALLRGASIATHLRRVDAVIRRVSNAMTAIAVAEVRDWTREYDRLRRLLDDDEAIRRLQGFMIDIGSESGFPLGRGATLLTRLAATPGGDLKATYDLAKLGEDVMGKLLPHIGDLMAEAGRGERLLFIHEEGTALAAALVRVRETAAADGVEA